MMRWAALACAGLVLLASGVARADSRPLVVIDGAAPTRLSRARLTGELSSMGFDVREAENDDGSDDLRAFSAVMTLRGRHIHVRVAGKRGEAFERREAEIDAGQSEEDLDAAMLRAAEFLRASFVAFGFVLPEARPRPTPAATVLLPFEQPPPRRSVPGRDDAPPPVERPGDRTGMSVGVGYGIAAGYGGMSSSGHLLPVLSWYLGHSFGLRLGGVLTTSPASASTPAGTTELRLTALTLGAAGSPVESRWVSPYLETGVGLGLMTMSSQPAPGYWEEQASAVTSVPYGGAGVILFRGALRPRLGVVAGTSIRRERMLADGQPTGTWGEVLLVGMAQVELAIE